MIKGEPESYDEMQARNHPPKEKGPLNRNPFILFINNCDESTYAAIMTLARKLLPDQLAKDRVVSTEQYQGLSKSEGHPNRHSEVHILYYHNDIQQDKSVRVAEFHSGPELKHKT